MYQESETTAHAALKIIVAAIVCVLLFYAVQHVHGQTPNLTISAGTAQSGSGLVISSDSARAWKRFAVTPASSGGTWSIVSAEHSTGDDGGIFFYTVTVSSGTATQPGPVTPPIPPAPQPADTPLQKLAAAAAIAAAGVPADQLTKAAGMYEGLAAAIDKGGIASPLQLQIGTGTQLLSVFTADEIASLKNLTAVFTGWLDAQQCCGYLIADHMEKYAAAYHALAAAIRPHPQAGTRMSTLATPKRETEPAPAIAAPPGQLPIPADLRKSPCATGQCPATGMPTMQGWLRRR